MHITKADVGRKVIHREGSVSEITGWDKGASYPVLSSHRSKRFRVNGAAWRDWEQHPQDIIAFADEQERKMKHVIAGEAREDVLEWRVIVDRDGHMMLEASKATGPWRIVATVSENGVIATNFDGCHKALGLKLAGLQ